MVERLMSNTLFSTLSCFQTIILNLTLIQHHQYNEII